MSNGKVVLRIIRRKKYKGKAALILVDRKGLGNFSNLINTTDASATDAIVLPEGQYSAAWSYRAIYMEGDLEISEWCPDLTVAVKVEAPNMELVVWANNLASDENARAQSIEYQNFAP